jgi:hypothetical protein
VATASLNGPGLDVQGQLALRGPGYDPPSGARPQSLPVDGRCGWALRVLWRGAGVRGRAMAAGARAAREVGGFPATADVGRLELVLQGGEPRQVDWRVRASRKVETVLGWAERLPWLPPARVSARHETRLSARLTARHEALGLRAAAAAAGLSRQDAAGVADTGWRSLASLRADLRLGRGLELRLNQVWSWGAPVDLVSVEVPAAGLVRPRHWGRRAGERSLGVAWRGPAWRVAAAFCVREDEDGGLEGEALVALHWGVR